MFIQAYRTYYAFDICPGYWTALLAHHDAERICSIDRVRTELLAGRDELADWVRETTPEAFFAKSDDPSIVAWFGRTMAWAQAHRQFLAAAKADFATKADGWLVAYAKALGCAVVTQEASRPNVRNRVPIPNVCDAFGVGYVGTFDMLRTLATQFQWQGS